MSKGEIKNAKIVDVSLTMADHGVLTFDLSLVGSGWGVGYGGYVIGKGYVGAKEFTAEGKGLVALMRIMDTVGVEKWEDLKGKYIRVVTEGWGSAVTTIGNILEDKWFNAREFFSEEKPCPAPAPAPTARAATIQTRDCSLFTRWRVDMDLADILGRIERGELKLSIGDSLLVGMKDGKKVEFVVTAVGDEAYRFESRDCLGKYVPMTKIQGFFDEVWGNLPDALKNHIVPTERPYLSKGNLKSISRKLFLPSAAEIFPPEDCYGDKGLYEQMDWYKDVHNRVRAFEGGGNADWYWTQSEYSGHATSFCVVGNGGIALYADASGTSVAAPVCFRISRL